MVQNAAASLWTSARKREHITRVIMSLHWLPVHFRIDFEVLLLVFKCLNGLGPSYLSVFLCEYYPVRTLRSANQSFLAFPKSKLKSRGDWAFTIAAPKLWNSLPIHIRTAQILHIFKTKLKTYLFIIAYYLWCPLLLHILYMYPLQFKPPPLSRTWTWDRPYGRRALQQGG